MDKTAQMRSRYDTWIRDKNPFSSATEFFNKEVEQVMKLIRTEDKKIRNVFLVSKKDSPTQMIANAESALKQREYLKAFIFLDNVREKFNQAEEIASSLRVEIKNDYKSFFVKNIENREKEQLIKLREKFKTYKEKNPKRLTTTASLDDGIVKLGGARWDWFKSLFSRRGRALLAWERANKEKVQALKEDLILLIEDAKTLNDEMFTAMKDMSFYISRRNVSKYMDEIKIFKKNAQYFDLKVFKFYDAHIKDLIDDLTENIPPESSESVPALTSSEPAEPAKPAEPAASVNPNVPNTAPEAKGKRRRRNASNFSIKTLNTLHKEAIRNLIKKANKK